MITIPHEVPIRNNISKLRKAQGINQEQMAEELGVTRWYLSKLENHKFVPSTQLMVKVCRYFGRELGEVFYIKREGSE